MQDIIHVCLTIASQGKMPDKPEDLKTVQGKSSEHSLNKSLARTRQTTVKMMVRITMTMVLIMVKRFSLSNQTWIHP